MMRHGFTFRWKCWVVFSALKTSHATAHGHGNSRTDHRRRLVTMSYLQMAASVWPSWLHQAAMPTRPEFLSSCCPQNNIYMAELPQPVSMRDVIKGRHANGFMILASHISILLALACTGQLARLFPTGDRWLQQSSANQLIGKDSAQIDQRGDHISFKRSETVYLSRPISPSNNLCQPARLSAAGGDDR